MPPADDRQTGKIAAHALLAYFYIRPRVGRGRGMSHYQQDVEALLAAILVRASDVLELPEHDREARR